MTFTPQEPWDHLEISGAAWGRMALEGYDDEKGADAATPLFERPRGQEKTYHRLAAPVIGKRLRFDNVEQETPMGELSAYYVAQDREPQGVEELSYTITLPEPPWTTPASNR